MEQKANNKHVAFNYTKYNLQAAQDWNLMFAKKTEAENSKDTKYENFRKRLSEFKGITTLEDAKVLLQKTMPVRLERTVFYIGDAKSTIINKENRLRISLDSPKEFISYDFV